MLELRVPICRYRAVDTRTDAKIRSAMRRYIPETRKIIIAQRSHRRRCSFASEGSERKPVRYGNQHQHYRSFSQYDQAVCGK